MVDFRKLLDDHRATKRMREQKPERVRSQPVQQTEVAPELYDLNIPRTEAMKLGWLMHQHKDHTKAQSQHREEKKPLIEQIKALCIKWGILSCVDAEGTKLKYYESTSSTISPYLLRAHGVSPQTIKDCTVTKTQWKLKITPSGHEEAEDEG